MLLGLGVLKLRIPKALSMFSNCLHLLWVKGAQHVKKVLFVNLSPLVDFVWHILHYQRSLRKLGPKLFYADFVVGWPVNLLDVGVDHHGLFPLKNVTGVGHCKLAIGHHIELYEKIMSHTKAYLQS